jgi:hypothetical protein
MVKNTKQKRKSPVRHRVKSHTRKNVLVRPYVRGHGNKNQKTFISKRKIEQKQFSKILPVPMKDIKADQFLLVPHGPSTDGKDWREGLMQATSWSGVQRNVEILKEKGYKSGKILAPFSEQEGRDVGFRVISSWGKQPPKSKTKGFQYPVDKKILSDELKEHPRKKAKLVWMSPETYLKQLVSPSSDFKNADECPSHIGYNRTVIDKYKHDIFKLGEVKLPPLRLFKSGKGENWFRKGDRHRAKAAYLATVKKVPVVVIEPRRN